MYRDFLPSLQDVSGSEFIRRRNITDSSGQLKSGHGLILKNCSESSINCYNNRTIDRIETVKHASDQASDWLRFTASEPKHQ